MIRTPSGLLALALAGLGVFAAYRIVAIAQADRLARTQPARALQWVPHHPLALLALGEQQLAASRIGEAQVTARRLLAVEPLEGRGFRILAQVAEKQGSPTQAVRLYLVAARRSPRDIPTRAWLTEHFLVTGHYAAALEQIDYLLRIAPSEHATLLPLLVQLSVDPDFAGALANVLEHRPAWRPALETALHDGKDPRASDNVMSAMAQLGTLSSEQSRTRKGAPVAGVDAGIQASSAARIAARLEVGAAILRNVDRRDPIPAGR